MEGITQQIMDRIGIWVSLAIVYCAYSVLTIYSRKNKNKVTMGKEFAFYAIWATILVLYAVGCTLSINDFYKSEDHKEITLIMTCYYITLLLVLSWGIIWYVSEAFDNSINKLLCVIINIIIAGLLVTNIYVSKKYYGFTIPFLGWMLIATGWTFMKKRGDLLIDNKLS